MLADFLPGGLGLVALFCFRCGMDEPGDQRVGCVRLVEPKHRVVGPESWQSESSGWMRESQRVTPMPPRAAVPSESWYRHRSERAPGLAASALLGYEMPALTGPFPEGFDPESIGALEKAYDDWTAPRHDDPWGGACLGGLPNWTQYDATPRCAHGERLHLLEYEGGQFLDGALHVFVCRAGACELAFLAEF